MEIYMFQNQRGNLVNVRVKVDIINDYSIIFTQRGTKFTIHSHYRINDYLFTHAGLSVLTMYVSGSNLYPMPIVASVKSPNFELKTELKSTIQATGISNHPEILSRMRTLESLVGEIQIKLKESSGLSKLDKLVPEEDQKWAKNRQKKDIIKV